MTIEEAIKAYTWGSAYASFEEKIKGTLIEGKLADITVLDTNFCCAKPTDWIDERGDVKVKTLYTIVGGGSFTSAEHNNENFNQIIAKSNQSY